MSASAPPESRNRPTGPVLFVVGCTGSGKGTLGRALGTRLDGEIVSLDSMKVYRHMDIGTAKPPPSVRTSLPHHLIDVVEPWEEFSVARYLPLAEVAMADIQSRGRIPIFVGGTPLYLKALVEGLFDGPKTDALVRTRLLDEAQHQGQDGLYERLASVDPGTAARLHAHDLKRVVRALEVWELSGKSISSLQAQWDRGVRRLDAILVGIRRDRDDQNRRTNARVTTMMAAGLVDEVKQIVGNGRGFGPTSRQAVGYAEILRYLDGDLSLADAMESMKISTRRLAKAQRTWLRRFQDIVWFDVQPNENLDHLTDRVLNLIEPVLTSP